MFLEIKPRKVIHSKENASLLDPGIDVLLLSDRESTSKTFVHAKIRFTSSTLISLQPAAYKFFCCLVWGSLQGERIYSCECIPVKPALTVASNIYAILILSKLTLSKKKKMGEKMPLVICGFTYCTWNTQICPFLHAKDKFNASVSF